MRANQRRTALVIVCLAWALSRAAPLSAQPVEEAAADLRQLSLLDLMGTEVVSAARSEQSLAEAAAVIEVITAKQIRERGYRTVGEALQSVSGIHLRDDQLQYDLGVRGVAGGIRSWSRPVKVMIDGQPVSYRPSGENFLGPELIPIAIVARIEVLRGPASVMYGANAFLGVVNIITRHGYSVHGDQLAAGYEGGEKQHTPFGRVAVGHSFDDFELLLGADFEARTLDGYKLVPLPGRTHPREDEHSDTIFAPSGSAYARLSYEGERTGLLSLEGHLSRLDRSAEFADWGVMSHRTRVQLYNGFARLRYEQIFLDRVELSLSAAFSGGGPGRADRLGLAPDQSTYVRREVGYRGYDLGGVVRVVLRGKSTLLVGTDANFEQQELQTHYTVHDEGQETRNPPASSQSGERLFHNLGAYTLATLYPFELFRFKPLAGLGLTAGLRFDAHNIYGTNLNGRAGLVYDFHELHYIKLLWGSSYRAPSSTQLFSNYVEPQGTVGNPKLRPERAQTAELALGTTLFTDITLRADGFLTIIRDRVEIQEPSVADGTSNPLPKNSTPIHSRGFELTADYRGRVLASFVSGSLQQSRYSTTNTLSVEREEVTLDTDLYPSFLVKGGITLTLRDFHVRAYAEARYVGPLAGHAKNNAQVNGLDYLTKQYQLDGYGVVDLSLGSVDVELWRGHETRLTAKVRNLTGSRYVQPGTAGFDIPGLERTYEVMLEQEL